MMWLVGKLDQNAVHGIVRVQLRHEVQQIMLGGIRREDRLDTCHAQFAGLSALAANIDFAGRIVAHQHDGEPGNPAGFRLKSRNGRYQTLRKAVGKSPAVDDLGAP